jgi:hypothetical protein
MASLNARAVGYGPSAADILKFCRPPAVQKKALYDFTCGAKFPLFVGQDYIPDEELIKNSSVTFMRPRDSSGDSEIGQWNNDKPETIELDIRSGTVKICQNWAFEIKVSMRELEMLNRTGCRSILESNLARTIAQRHKNIQDPYGFQMLVGSAGHVIGTAGAPVTPTKADYDRMLKQIIRQTGESEMICDVGEIDNDVVVALPWCFLDAHLEFFKGDNVCCSGEDIRMGIKRYKTPYGINIHFVKDKFLPKSSTGRVMGVWADKTRVGFPNEMLYLQWDNVKSDVYLFGESIWDAYLLDCNAAGAIFTDCVPVCPLTC